MKFLSENTVLSHGYSSSFPHFMSPYIVAIKRSSPQSDITLFCVIKRSNRLGALLKIASTGIL